MTEGAEGRRRPARDPGRSCVACGRQAPADELLRVTALPDEGLVLDWRRRLGGRGAHICASRNCIERAVAGRSFDRVLRARPVYPTPAALVEMARAVFERRIETLLQSARGAGALVSGADPVTGALVRGTVRCLVVAADAANSARLLARAERDGVPAGMALDKERIGGLLGRPDTGVVGITDEGLARALR
ncbi:MAG TPA: DUF448 domain-containing protein, partial [Polyangia bacterium]|nr:DUF448 domain-containing protein [Polyangia bacterium]